MAVWRIDTIQEVKSYRLNLEVPPRLWFVPSVTSSGSLVTWRTLPYARNSRLSIVRLIGAPSFRPPPPNPQSHAAYYRTKLQSTSVQHSGLNGCGSDSPCDVLAQWTGFMLSWASDLWSEGFEEWGVGWDEYKVGDVGTAFFRALQGVETDVSVLFVLNSFLFHSPCLFKQNRSWTLNANNQILIWCWI